MTLSELYELADRLGVKIDDFRMQEIISASFPEGYVAIDKYKVNDYTEEKVIIAHELGHVETGSFYTTGTSNLHIREKCERQADEWAILRTVPKDELDAEMKNGSTTVWELAEHFGITTDAMWKAILYYKQKEGIR